MLEFSILDFVLISSLCYLCGVGTGLAICCKSPQEGQLSGAGKNKETFLQREKSLENLQSYNHHTSAFPAVPSAPIKLG